jgi:hypothetical protein
MSYITKRRHCYYATLNVPVKLQDHFGKTRFIRSLQTDSLAVAQKRTPILIAAWKSEIEQARGQVGQDDVEYWRRQLEAAQGDEEKRHVLAALDRVAEDKARPV